jgi:branched-chain amino acid transport system ATP-binding protein
LLKVDSIETSYGKIKILKGVDINVKQGEIVSIVGANGAGKSTLLKTLIGALKCERGSIEYLGRRIEKEPSYARVRKGLGLVPEGRIIFTGMTVFENLLTGGFARKDQKALRAEADSILDRFLPLKARRDNSAIVLSGGEQQMLTIARALMARPKLLMVDEPSLGLAPVIIDEVFEIIADLRSKGITILLVEQNAIQALKLAERGYVMDQGMIVAHDSADMLLKNLKELEKTYFGVRDLQIQEKGGEKKITG